MRRCTTSLFFLLALALIGPAAAAAGPTATTEAATNLQSPAVTLNGTVNPGGAETTYRFQYGTTTAYGKSAPVPAKAIGSGASDVKVSQAVGDLEPSTTYHFRLVAESAQGTATGQDKTFTTPEWAIASTDTPPGASLSVLAGASCTSTTDCTVVGHYKDAAGSVATLAERRSGGEWSIQPTPNPTGALESRLRSVSCTSASLCTAVGHYKSAAGTFFTLAERWNGSTWTIMPTPNPIGSLESRLESLSCVSASDCTAVGYYKTGSDAFSTLIEHWNGTAWSIVSSPNPSGLAKRYLRGVSCVSASECWAVGQSAPGPTELSEGKTATAFAAHFDGKAWSLGAMPEAPANLTNVSCSSASWCLAVTGAEGHRTPPITSG